MYLLFFACSCITYVFGINRGGGLNDSRGGGGGSVGIMHMGQSAYS
jgi:hypothetical protein